MRRYPLFDVFRLVLAANVVRFHAFDGTGIGIQIIPTVPLFLAISGFLVLQSYENSGSWREFAKRRVLRVVPAFVAMLGLVAALFGLPMVWDVIVEYLSLGHHSSVNGAVWSLGWEELFYAGLALLFVGGAYRKRTPIWILAALSAVLLVSAWSYGIKHYNLHLPLPLPLAFFVGNLCYLYRDKVGILWPVAIGALMLAAFWPLREWKTVDGLQMAVHTLLGSVGMVAVAVRFRPRLPRFPDLSYGLYVYHRPLIGWLAAAGLPLGWLWISLPAVCAASWYAVEAPALRLKGRRIQAEPA